MMMNIETFYRSEIFIDCSSEEWEKIENKYYIIGYKYIDVDVSSFGGCPAAGPYLTMISESKVSLERMHKEVMKYINLFKNIKVS